MALIQWDNSFSVNVIQIDEQHKVLVKLINDLDDAMRSGKGKDIIGVIIAKLIRYTTEHFSTEEKYFVRFDYAEALPHKAEHAQFVNEVSMFKQQFDAGQIGLSLKVMNFLSNWLTKHIIGSDKKYSSTFNAHGLT